MKKYFIPSLLIVLATGCLAGNEVDPLRITAIELSPVSCLPDGPKTATVTIHVTGGAPSYQFRAKKGDFQSSNVFSGLTAGEYDFEIKDASSNGTSIFAFVSFARSAFDSITTSQEPYCDDRYNKAVITVNSEGGINPKHELNMGQQIISGNDGQFDPITASTVLIASDDDSGCNPTGIAFDIIIPQASSNDSEDFVNAKFPCIN